jgi:stage V sporulation protein G
MTAVSVEVADIRKITGNSKLKAVADLKIAESVLVKGFSVMDGRNGIFVSMPRKSGMDGKWYDILLPLNDDFKRQVEEKVLEAFGRETDGGN